MPRNGSGIYSKPSGTNAVSGTTIESSKYNAQVDDLVVDANAPRPVPAGGTGASNAAGARGNLGVPTSLDDVNAIQGTALTYTVGQFGTVVPGDYVQTRAEGFSYQVAAEDESDHHLTTAGGVKLYVMPGDDGAYIVEAFGAEGDGIADDTEAFRTMLASTGSRVFRPDPEKTYHITGQLDFGRVSYFVSKLNLRVTGSRTDEGADLCRDRAFFAHAPRLRFPLGGLVLREIL